MKKKKSDRYASKKMANEKRKKKKTDQRSLVRRALLFHSLHTVVAFQAKRSEKHCSNALLIVARISMIDIDNTIPGLVCLVCQLNHEWKLYNFFSPKFKSPREPLFFDA